MSDKQSIKCTGVNHRAIKLPTIPRFLVNMFFSHCHTTYNLPRRTCEIFDAQPVKIWKPKHRSPGLLAVEISVEREFIER